MEMTRRKFISVISAAVSGSLIVPPKIWANVQKEELTDDLQLIEPRIKKVEFYYRHRNMEQLFNFTLDMGSLASRRLTMFRTRIGDPVSTSIEVVSSKEDAAFFEAWMRSDMIDGLPFPIAFSCGDISATYQAVLHSWHKSRYSKEEIRLDATFEAISPVKLMFNTR